MVEFIKVEGDAKTRGLQQGDQLHDKIHHSLEKVFNSKMFKQVTTWYMPLSIVKFGLGSLGLRKIKKHLKSELPNQYEKLVGISESSGLSERLTFGLHYVEVLASIPENIFRNPPIQACSMIMARGSATENNEILFARNYDYPKILRDFQMVRLEKPTNGYKNLNMSQFPLAGSHMGLNEHGLAIGYNSGRTWKKEPLDIRAEGVPMTLIVQAALEECKTMEDAVEFIGNFPARNVGAFLGIVDKSGEICILETTSTRHALRLPENDWLVQTNLYMTPELKDANIPNDVHWKMEDMDIPYSRSPKMRYDRAHKLISQKEGNITLETLKTTLADHDNREPDDFTLCQHGSTGITLASILIKPETLEFWATDKHPCLGEHEKIDFTA